ncbi:energy transducer TonB [Paraburkholderia adhaesiva]|uniref:energy transducer TonB n=1 Tax=Paraburkholderia adhaesiva TaxID=2883244 RepID=UPI001F29821D|nr:energy transducer TonB [Paraburkholderia adhaesiva]
MLFAAGADRRVATAIALVVALHATLIAIVLTRRDASTSVALGSHAITAELLQPDPVAVAAAASLPPTPPKPVQRVAHAKPAVQPTVRPVPLPVAQAPSEHQNETAAQALPTPSAAAPSAPEASPPAAAPAQGKPTMELSAPKNVSHLDCRIAQPDYPMLSKRRGETGTASVSFVVGLSGQIEDIRLQKSSGYSRLDDAALAAMRDSSCKPYKENGEPVRAAYTQPFDFSLHN